MHASKITEPFGKASAIRKARLAGGLWLSCILTGIVGGLAGLPLIVAKDSAATAAKILANESLFRLSFVVDLISYATYLGATVFIYDVLKPVNRSLSLLGLSFGLVGVVIGVVAWAYDLVPLVLLHEDQYLSASFTASQLQALSLGAFNLQLLMLSVAMVFFGVQVVSIGYLIARSTFLPFMLGVILAIGGTSYVLSSFFSFLTPAFGARLLPFSLFAAFIGEGSLSLWLLFKGLNVKRWNERANGPQ